MRRYAAKLLFQFRANVDGVPGKRRICEERIINFKASSHTEALRDAKRQGSKSRFNYKNSDGNPVHFEFVGVMDLMTLGTETTAGEVWYDVYTRLTPMERRKKSAKRCRADAASDRQALAGSGSSRLIHIPAVGK